jgi:SAM-dependent methyltransferase
MARPLGFASARTREQPSRITSAAAQADIIEWDVANWAPALEFWRQYTSIEIRGSSALEIGSRHGGLSLWLALSGAAVVCSDLNAPTDEARRKHRRYGVAHRVTYDNVDALDIPYDEQFDVVVFKSVLGGIGGARGREAQRQALKQIHKALKRGGELWFAENLTASPVHRALRRACVSWAYRWRYPSIDDLLEFTAPFSSCIWTTSGVLGAFGRSEAQRAALSRLDRWMFNRVTPPAWRYIAVGIARK